MLRTKNKCVYYIIFFSMFFTQACANPIIDQYKTTVDSYNKAISEQKYKNAYELSEVLLAIDPSDTLSLLRLAFSSKMLNEKNESVIGEYLQVVERSSIQDQEIIDLIIAIQASKN